MQVWPSKTFLQKTGGALLDKSLTTVGSLGREGFFLWGFGITFGVLFE